MHKLLSIILLFLITASINVVATEDFDDNKADCLILKEENSIICKYVHKRINEDKSVRFEWIEPDGSITRIKDLIIPAGHGSVYDYRFIQGRTKGIWTFKVIDAGAEITTNFTLE